MARRPVPMMATAVAALVLVLVLGPLPVLLMHGSASFHPADWAAVRFTLFQAGLSAIISILLAIPVARALARRRFAGRGALIALMGAPFLMPVIVVVLGLLAVVGQRGWLAALGLPVPSLYGLHGVIAAHVVLNMPLAARIILQGWQAIPGERLRLASSLGFDGRAVWQHLERPMLREVLPGAALAIFLVCLTSFAIVLILGGGPAATTLELAIYQAVRFEFDLPRAALLALVQFAVCTVAVLTTRRVAQPAGLGTGLDRAAVSLAPRGFRLAGDIAVLALAGALVSLPILAAVWRGLAGMADLPPQVWPALARSLVVANLSAGLSVAAALVLAQAVATGRRGYEHVAMIPLAASTLVLGTGLFLVVFPFVSPVRVALPVTIVVNAVLAMPFAFRILLPQVTSLQADYGRLIASLDLRGWSRLRLVTLPRLRRPLGFALGVTAALAMGDLGAIALFAGERGATLPLLVQRLMGAYRMDAAAAAALLLLVVNFGLFWGYDRWGRRRADA